jgi:hypothetical protein
MFSAILIILTMAFGDLAKLRGIQFKPLNKAMFFIFVGNLLLLMVLGAKHVESPFIEIGQIATLVYFLYFVVTIPMSTIFENSINEFYTQIKGKLSKFYKSTQYDNNNIPNPYNFITKNLRSGSDLPDLINTIADISKQLVEYSDMVNDFNNTASHNNIDFDSKSGDITKPSGLSEGMFDQIMNKLINSSLIIEAKKESLNSLFKKGAPIAKQLQEMHPDQHAQFTSKISEFSSTASKYKGS